MSDDAMVHLRPAVATAIAARILGAWGVPESQAAIVADHLVENDRKGVASHGLLRIPQYVDEIERGEIDPAAVPAPVGDGVGAHQVVDGRRCLGPVACHEAVRLAAARASREGLAAVNVLQAGHCGRVGAYPERLAGQGLIGLTFCSGPRSGHRVAPFGGTEGRMATNPIAYAFAAGGEVISADFSTSALPEGKVRLLSQTGRAAPASALLDAQGRETDDPNVLYRTPAGTIQPLGGLLYGHKGTALGLLVELLATLYGGEDATDGSRVGNNVAIVALTPPPGFAEHAARLAEYVRSSPPADPARPVLLPGEREQRHRRDHPHVPVHRTVWDQIRQTAARKDVAVSLDG